MRILFIVPYVPTPVRCRPYNLVRSLSSLGHSVTLLTIVTSEEEDAQVGALRRAGIEVESVRVGTLRSLLNCAVALPTGAPLQSAYSWSPELARRAVLLALEDGRFDVVHVEHLRGSRYGLFIKDRAKTLGRQVPVVWDSVDCISLLFRQASIQGRNWSSRMLTRLELRRTERHERFLLRQFDGVLVTSPVDREALLSLLPAGGAGTEIATVPNGVDLDYFRPDDSRPREAETIVVSGKMSYHANVAMVCQLMEEIMPRVWGRLPSARVVVAGKDPHPKVKAFGRNPRVTITGTVEDIRPFLQTATVAVAPVVYGAGLQNKVLEAMACATPVVTSPLAIRALLDGANRHVIAADGAAPFADSIVQLLRQRDRRESLGRSSREFVEQNYQWKQVARQVTGIYAEVAGLRKVAGRAWSAGGVQVS